MIDDKQYDVLTKCIEKMIVMDHYMICSDGSKKYFRYIDEHDNVIDSLNDSIGLGGGFTLSDDCEPYWMVYYYRGIRFELINEQMVTIKFSRSEVLKIAESIWLKHKKHQLTLF